VVQLDVGHPSAADASVLLHELAEGVDDGHRLDAARLLHLEQVEAGGRASVAQATYVI
jgi:hypothetical protein